jgi:hypothetical protein
VKALAGEIAVTGTLPVTVTTRDPGRLTP